ncbi:MAG: glycogen-binding domain-containing protein, partial [Planctomycetota bacterium]|nr:glycogen-binding domain-containing protein [Planctomycetota bacterium]
GSCFAILFLKRSTVPVLERVATGSVQKAGSTTTQGPSMKKLADGRYEVTLRYKGRSGSRVSVAGSFNGWNKDQNPMSDKGNGMFEVTLTLNAGAHQYKFVVDGQQWLTDPKNSKRQKDSSGNENSLLDLQ